MTKIDSSTSTGRPSSATSETFRQAPWVTTTPVSPGARAATMSRSAGTMRPVTSSMVSAPGTPPVMWPEAQRACASGYFSANSATVSPARSPTSNSRTRGSGVATRPVAASTYDAVSRARARSLLHSSVGRRSARYGAAAAAWARPVSSRGTSVCPWARPSRFQAVRPCRSSTSRRPPAVSAASTAERWRSALNSAARGDVGGQLDHGAVAPQPLEGVELPLLLVLDVDHDLAVVDEDPPSVALALATDGLRADLAQLVLDLVDDRLDLAVVGGGGEQEGVGDGELLADVEGHDVRGELVGGGPRGSADELEGVVGGGHRRSLSMVVSTGSTTDGG